VRYLFDPTIENRIKVCRARAYLRVVAGKRHPLLCDILKPKENRHKKGGSWMGLDEDILEQICPLKDLEPREEWIQLPKDCCTLFNVCITLNHHHNPITPGVGSRGVKNDELILHRALHCSLLSAMRISLGMLHFVHCFMLSDQFFC
jgi:hypothetical protein